MAGTLAAHATETLKLKTAISIPNGGKITSFDISFVDTATGTYVLGDRTNKGIDVIDTATNTVRFIAGQGLFVGVFLRPDGSANNDRSGPDGAMVVNNSEIWAGDGDSTLKFLALGDGGFLGQISTNTRNQQPPTRVDEMCFDPVNQIGFVANNAGDPPFISAVSAITHSIIGQIFFDGSSGSPVASNGIEQCAWNPRDGFTYVAVPEVCPPGFSPGSPQCPGDNSVSGAVARIDPTTCNGVTCQVVAVAVVPHAACAGPQGLAIGPVSSSITGFVAVDGNPLDGKSTLTNFGQMLTGCNGAVFNAGSLRPTAIVDDGSQPGGSFGRTIALPFQAGNDMVAYNSADNHYYLARSGNNSFANPAPDPVTPTIRYGCPNTTNYINYGGAIFVGPGGDHLANAYGDDAARVFAGPSVLGMVNAATLENDPDTITGLFNCAATNPGPGGVGKAGVANAHGAAHSVAADPANNQIYVPIASTAVTAPQVGLCSQSGVATDSLGCIAVFVPVGSDP